MGSMACTQTSDGMGRHPSDPSIAPVTMGTVHSSSSDFDLAIISMIILEKIG